MLSSKLKELRALNNLTQAELAKRIGVSQQAVAKWETNKAEPDYETLNKLTSMFGVTFDYLLSEEDNPQNKYYLDQETARIANEMKENPGRRVLFDATRNLSPEKIKQVKDFVDFITRDQDFSE